MSCEAEAREWLRKNLNNLSPGLSAPHIIDCVMKIENDRDFNALFTMLVDISTPEYKTFLSNFKKLRFSKDSMENDTKSEQFLKSRDGASKNKKGNAADSSPKDKESNSNNLQSSMSKDQDENTADQKKKKTKYVNLYSSEGMQKDVILLKGRHLCECQATKHRLVNNCLKCGRIVCEQERSGPCLFCGAMVISRGERSLLNSDSKESRELYVAVNDMMKAEQLSEALEKRDKLLDYDKSVAQRTRVIDDEGDYFNTNSAWLSKEEREKMQQMQAEFHEKKHLSRLDKKIKFDLLGRTVVDDEFEGEPDEKFVNAFQNLVLSREKTAVNCCHPDIPLVVQPRYEILDGNPRPEKLGTEDPKSSDWKLISSKVQDKEFLEIADQGICLSVHQPFASLLVFGIMRYEGRTWYSSHRGRLWIASTSKQPKEEEIRDAEKFFKRVRNDNNLKFPKFYPTSSLLGCVSLTECLPQEEFLAKYPEGECESPFVFVCEDPRPLDIFFPIVGSHKMYQLDRNIHTAACKALMRIAKNKS